MSVNQACDDNSIITKESWGTVCIGVFMRTILIVLFIIIMWVFLARTSVVASYTRRDIYERYGTSLMVTDVTSVAGGHGDSWTAQCSSLEVPSDENQVLILKPVNVRIKAPEEGMRITYTISQLDFVIEVEAGESPEVLISDWNELTEQQGS